MLLNPFERRLVSGWPRRWVVRHWDLPRLRRAGGDCRGKRVLEIGCGRGFGVEAAYDLLAAHVVHAFDPDADLVASARQSMTRAGAFSRTPPARIWQGTATAITAPDAAYDVVLCLQVLHHVQNWRLAVREIARVLQPGGSLLLAESLIGFLRHPILGRWMDHPTEDRFSLDDLVQELNSAGFRIRNTRGRGRWMTWLVAELKEPATTPAGSVRSPDAPKPDPARPPTIPGP